MCIHGNLIRSRAQGVIRGVVMFQKRTINMSKETYSHVKGALYSTKRALKEASIVSMAFG